MPIPSSSAHNADAASAGSGHAGLGGTFSESWHRVAGRRISLRPTVAVRKQIFRGETWHVLHDPFNNSFFRLRPEAYRFVARLRQDRTVDETWRECLEADPDRAPGQDEVIGLLAQLYHASLLYHDLPPEGIRLLEQYRRRKQRETQSKFLSLMFVRLPLFDPEPLLKRWMPAVRVAMSPMGAAIWLLAVLFAGKAVLDRFDEAASQARDLLSQDNLFFLYAGLVLIKTLHEFGHAFACKRFGGEVHVMGVMFMIFTPLPYMDATSSWSFRDRRRRVLVASAGMLFEMFAAALAALVWAYAGPGAAKSIAFNMMIIGSVSTIIFNANPLLRYDGYYILSDLLGIPNLHSRARAQLRHLAEGRLFGCAGSADPAGTAREALWLSVYGVLSGIYRIVVFGAIILLVANRFLLAGVVMALVCVVTWGVIPIARLGAYLLWSPRIARNRGRALAVSLGTAAAMLLVLGLWPFPSGFRAPGVLEAVSHVKVVNESPGYVKTVLVPSGTEVTAGTLLMELADEELHLEIAAAEAQLRETQAMRMGAMPLRGADVEPIRNRLRTIEKKLANLEEQRRNLTVTARAKGTWVAPGTREMVGKWLPRGSELGAIVDHGAFRFAAVVSQSEASNLFGDGIRSAEVRLSGQGSLALKAENYRFIPFQHRKLPSAALGWQGGGNVPVTVGDESGLVTVEPFFQIYADVGGPPPSALLHGRSGQIRLTLPPEPLLGQWGRRARQMLQQRYRI